MAIVPATVDVAAATARRIPVTTIPPIVTEATADLAFALLLAVARRVVEADAALRRGLFPGSQSHHFAGAAVHGKTLGVVGLGRIGRAVARRAAAAGIDEHCPRAEQDRERAAPDDLLRFGRNDSNNVARHTEPAARGRIEQRPRGVNRAFCDRAKQSVREKLASPARQIGHCIPPTTSQPLCPGGERRTRRQGPQNPDSGAAAVCSEDRICARLPTPHDRRAASPNAL
jgi:hypothetical protein